MDAAGRFKHPTLWPQHLGDAAQESHPWESWGQDESVFGTDEWLPLPLLLQYVAVFFIFVQLNPRFNNRSVIVKSRKNKRKPCSDELLALFFSLHIRRNESLLQSLAAVDAISVTEIHKKTNVFHSEGVHNGYL